MGRVGWCLSLVVSVAGYCCGRSLVEWLLFWLARHYGVVVVVIMATVFCVNNHLYYVVGFDVRVLDEHLITEQLAAVEPPLAARPHTLQSLEWKKEWQSVTCTFYFKTLSS